MDDKIVIRMTTDKQLLQVDAKGHWVQFHQFYMMQLTLIEEREFDGGIIVKIYSVDERLSEGND